MALIKCNECGKEISDKAKVCPNCGGKNNIMICIECKKEISKTNSQCPYCGFKVLKTKNKLNNILLIIFLIIISILSFFLIGYSTDPNYYLYHSKWYRVDVERQNLLSISIFVIIIGLILLLIKLFKNKEKKLKKILCIVGIIVGIIPLIIYIPNYLQAKKLNYDISLKVLVDAGYSLETAKNIESELNNAIFSHMVHREDVQIRYIEEENNELIFHMDYHTDSLPLKVKITNNSLEYIYWDYNADLKFYFYKDFKPTSKADYYSKVLTTYYNFDDYNLKDKIKMKIKEMLKSPSSAKFGEFGDWWNIYYLSDTDTIYFKVSVDSQNSFGAMVRTDFRVDLKNTSNDSLDYSIKVMD